MKAPDKGDRAGEDTPRDRIMWFRGNLQAGPRQTIGVLEVRDNGGCRVVFAERAEVDARCHIRLARLAWGPKTCLETRWWSLVLGEDQKVHTVRNGSCGDAVNTVDIPRVIRALEELGLANEHVMIVVDDGPAVLPWWPKKQGSSNNAQSSSTDEDAAEAHGDKINRRVRRRGSRAKRFTSG